jgi:hypothetical protein
MMNMRDSLQKQIFYSTLYKKLLVWHDLNIQADEWCHKKVVECITQINEFQENLSFMPTRLQFSKVSLEISGYFSSSETEQCDSTYTLDAMIEHINDMESLIKKNFLTPKDKIQEMYEANPV